MLNVGRFFYNNISSLLMLLAVAGNSLFEKLRRLSILYFLEASLSIEPFQMCIRDCKTFFSFQYPPPELLQKSDDVVLLQRATQRANQSVVHRKLAPSQNGDEGGKNP